MEVLVFKTSVNSPQHVQILQPMLDSTAGIGRWNFALDDCDKILRIVSTHVDPATTIQILQSKGYECAELED